ncbi:MAG: hypothetical protein GF330_06955 [Candidatus Eisenbacteria bacterium]|nr:hypothetical protein [Candidatus Eisenbacteria bacterium]
MKHLRRTAPWRPGRGTGAVLITALLLLASLPGGAGAQLTGGFAAEETETVEFTLAETREILLANEIEPQLVERYLSRFDAERTFTESEIELMVGLLSSGIGPAEGEAAGEMPADEEEEAEVREAILYPPELAARLVRPFGHGYFRRPPPETAPIEDLTVGSDYVVGIGDQVLITVWGGIEKRYIRTVDRQGRLILPEIGVVTAAGRSLGELREELAALFGQIYNDFQMAVSIGDVRTIQVYVTGDVESPGSYTLSALATVFTALYYAGGPTPSGSLRGIQLSRRSAEMEQIDLYDFLLSGNRNMDRPLQSGDVVHVPPLGPTVRVTGEVRRPAVYEIRQGESLRDLVAMAGGLTPLAFDQVVTVDRFSETSGTQIFRVDWGDPRQDPLLRGGDEVTVYSVYHVHPREYVEIHGMVQEPGTYRLVPGMRIADLLFRAGGTREGAYLEQAELARIDESRSDSTTRTTLVSFPLRELIEDPDHPANRVLQRGDKLFIRTSPGWQPSPVVVLEGEVRFPGGYGLQSLTERISDVVARAGGPTADAFLKGAQLFRQDEGRVIINFRRALEDMRSSDNIALVDGDSIYVPRTPETVRVSGAVAIPGLLLHTPGKKSSYYIEKTGGFTEKANTGGVKIIRVTGEAERASRRFWPDPVVQAGDEIRVAELEEQKPIDWGKTLKEATTIVASLATTVYVISKIDQ